MLDWSQYTTPWSHQIEGWAARNEDHGRLIALVAGLVLLLTLPAAWTIAATWSFDDWSVPVLLPSLLLAILLGVTSSSAFGTARRLREIRRLIPLHAARVCPHCRAPLPTEPLLAECPACRKAYELRQLHAYWEQYARNPSKAREILRVPLPGQVVRRHGTGWYVGVAVLSVFLIAAGALGGIAVAGALMGPESGASVSRLWPTAITAGAIATVSLLMHDRRPPLAITRHCEKCGYQQPPDGPVTPLCAECGARWDLPGTVVIRCERD